MLILKSQTGNSYQKNQIIPKLTSGLFLLSLLKKRHKKGETALCGLFSVDSLILGLKLLVQQHC